MRLTRWVQLTGGLGNQLFQLAFAKQLQLENFAVGVYSNIGRSQAQHSSSTALVDYLEGKGMRLAGKGTTLCLRLLGASETVTRTLLQNTALGKRQLLDPHLIPMTAPSVINRGYYQSPSLRPDAIDYVVDFVRGCMPAAGIASSGITMHVRRGDYALHRSTIGMLSDSFFLKNALLLAAEGAEKRVQIVTDGDVKSLAKLLEGAGFKTSVISRRKTTNAFSLLADIGSSSKFLILSNSTLSWWAAACGSSECIVFPQPWYRSLRPHHMGLPGWRASSPDWS